MLKVELRADVAIKDGKVAAIEPQIPTDQAAEIVDATGQYVCPGLIDMHTHVYWGATYWGIEADALAATTGVTVSRMKRAKKDQQSTALTIAPAWY